MKNNVFCIFLILLLTGCIQRNESSHKTVEQHPDQQNLQKEVDSLRTKLANAYKPGFGDFMLAVQIHHAKLWFAGQNKNWELADFELHEIRETLDDIRSYQPERKESALLPDLYANIDSLSTAVKAQNEAAFKHNFIDLTHACNSCHRSTNHGFNIVKIPDSPPFSNQVFRLGKSN